MAKASGGRRKADAGGDGTPPPTNAQVVREAEEAALLSIMAQLRAQTTKAEAAKAIFDGEKAVLTEIFNHAKGTPFKFTRKELQGYLDDGKVTGGRKSLVEAEERRARHREFLGLPAGQTANLFADLPLEAKDEIAWDADGYQAGVRADEPKPPQDCPQRFTQAWMKGWHNGQARNGWALKKNAETPAPPPPAPDDTFETPPAELAAQAGRTKRGEGGEVVEMTTAARKRTEKAEEQRLRDSLKSPEEAV